MELYTREHVEALNLEVSGGSMPVSREPAKNGVKSMFRCVRCGRIFQNKEVHLCHGTVNEIDLTFEPVFVSDKPPQEENRPHSQSIPQLQKLIHSIVCQASVISFLQIAEEGHTQVDGVKNIPSTRLALVNGIESLGEQASNLIERMDKR